MALLYDQRVAFLKRLTEAEAAEHNNRSRQRVKQRKSLDAICLLEEMSFEKFFEARQVLSIPDSLGEGVPQGGRGITKWSVTIGHGSNSGYCGQPVVLRAKDSRGLMGANQFLEVFRAQPVERFEGKN